MTSKTIQNKPANETVSVDLVPVWLRLKDATRFSGLSRSTLYELFDTSGGPIKTSCLRQRGRTRGIRLIHRESLLGCIEAFSGAQEEGGAA